MICVLLVLVAVFCVSNAQFPAVCNNEVSLTNKTCCPNDCSGPVRGTCKNIKENVTKQWAEVSNQTVVNIMKNAPNEKQDKGTIDSRYLWPTLVFENVCECKGHYGGVDCSECDFGWTGEDCNEKKSPVLRRNFRNLTDTEKEIVANATLGLKNEMGYWSVVVEEPADYNSTETVKLQNVSTYDFFIYLHNFVACGGSGQCTKTVNKNVYIDFAHSGPVFPVWHRRYILTVEKEFQRYLSDPTFGLPYWKWEENSRAPFEYNYYGEPANEYDPPAVNVSGRVINPEKWNTICDIRYWNNSASCQELWKPCNPANYLAEARPLQRGPTQPISIYLPDKVEVMIALAAPSYDAPDSNGQYFRNSPRLSFRSRLEGWNNMCSKNLCFTSNSSDFARMHNLVHDWVGGQMDIVPAAVNDPIFNFHHCNVDRIVESWMQRFTMNSIISRDLLPPYIPVSDGHPGHNRDDYMVPFFPLVKPGVQYDVAEAWGYKYDELIEASINDYDIRDCNITEVCAICAANETCIDCENEMNQTCPAIVTATSFIPDAAGISTGGESESNAQGLELGLGLGLGIPLVISLVVIIVLAALLIVRKVSNKHRRATIARKSGEEEVDIGDPEEPLAMTELIPAETQT